MNLIEKRLQELIAEGTVLVDVNGAAVGQVNGLAVYQMGDFSFGKPSRITAKTFVGRGGIVNIERESKLSGKTHDKGVLILGGYLGGKYAQQTPALVVERASALSSPTMESTATARHRPNFTRSCQAFRKFPSSRASRSPVRSIRTAKYKPSAGSITKSRGTTMFAASRDLQTGRA